MKPLDNYKKLKKLQIEPQNNPQKGKSAIDILVKKKI